MFTPQKSTLLRIPTLMTAPTLAEEDEDDYGEITQEDYWTQLDSFNKFIQNTMQELVDENSDLILSEEEETVMILMTPEDLENSRLQLQGIDPNANDREFDPAARSKAGICKRSAQLICMSTILCSLYL
ncbi:DNA-dependent RNA polymerase II [Marasmius sp. AFHP31]|nr:DNA-dependent RNA polymerase II [Marasmius sp. AFHP31]